VRQILMNVLMLLSARTTLNVRILMDLTCIVSYTGTILFTIWSPIAFHTCYKIVHKGSQFGPQMPSINAKENSSYKFKMLFPIAFHTY
jgi:hypothetical protein